MPKKKKKPETSFLEQIRKIQAAGLSGSRSLIISKNDNLDQNLTERIESLIDIYNEQAKNKSLNMLCFIMYDIESNKIRRHVAKYLKRKGCVRVQKSVFVGNINRKVYKEMHETLKEIQEMYENNDSIFFLPVTENELASMKIVGQKINLELISDKPNTLIV